MKDSEVISVDFSLFKNNVKKDIELYNNILMKMQKEDEKQIVKIS